MGKILNLGRKILPFFFFTYGPGTKIVDDWLAQQAKRGRTA